MTQEGLPLNAHTCMHMHTHRCVYTHTHIHTHVPNAEIARELLVPKGAA